MPNLNGNNWIAYRLGVKGDPMINNDCSCSLTESGSLGFYEAGGTQKFIEKTHHDSMTFESNNTGWWFKLKTGDQEGASNHVMGIVRTHDGCHVDVVAALSLSTAGNPKIKEATYRLRAMKHSGTKNLVTDSTELLVRKDTIDGKDYMVVSLPIHGIKPVVFLQSWTETDTLNLAKDKLKLSLRALPRKVNGTDAEFVLMGKVIWEGGMPDGEGQQHPGGGEDDADVFTAVRVGPPEPCY